MERALPRGYSCGASSVGVRVTAPLRPKCGSRQLREERGRGGGGGGALLLPGRGAGRRAEAPVLRGCSGSGRRRQPRCATATAAAPQLGARQRPPRRAGGTRLVPAAAWRIYPAGLSAPGARRQTQQRRGRWRPLSPCSGQPPSRRWPPRSDGEGRGECGLRAPPVPLPPLGLGEREAPTLGSAVLRPSRAASGAAAASAHGRFLCAGRPEERGGPAAVPARRASAGRDRGGHTQPACCRPAAPPVALCRRRERAAGDVLLLLPGVGERLCRQPAGAWVSWCVCRGQCRGSVPGSTSAPLSHQVRSVNVYYVTGDLIF